MDIVVIEIGLGMNSCSLAGMDASKRSHQERLMGKAEWYGDDDDGLRCANSWRSQSGLYLPLPLRCRSKSPGTWSQVQCVDLGP